MQVSIKATNSATSLKRSQGGHRPTHCDVLLPGHNRSKPGTISSDFSSRLWRL